MSKLFTVSCADLGGRKMIVFVNWSHTGKALLDRIGDEGQYADRIIEIGLEIINKAASAPVESEK